MLQSTYNIKEFISGGETKIKRINKMGVNFRFFFVLCDYVFTVIIGKICPISPIRSDKRSLVVGGLTV